MICLSETWATLHIIIIPIFLEGCECLVSEALCVFYNVEKVKKISLIEKYADWITLLCTIGKVDLIMVSIYIRTRNGTNRLEVLKYIIWSLKEKCDLSILVGGDFNTRIGTRNQLCEDVYGSLQLNLERNTCDSKKNKIGGLLCEDLEGLSFFCLNGRTKGDICGILKSSITFFQCTMHEMVYLLNV